MRGDLLDTEAPKLRKFARRAEGLSSFVSKRNPKSGVAATPSWILARFRQIIEEMQKKPLSLEREHASLGQLYALQLMIDFKDPYFDYFVIGMEKEVAILTQTLTFLEAATRKLCGSKSSKSRSVLAEDFLAEYFNDLEIARDACAQTAGRTEQLQEFRASEGGLPSLSRRAVTAEEERNSPFLRPGRVDPVPKTTWNCRRGKLKAVSGRKQQGH